jgi:putative PIN family toxin of toxin-antitoxin system
LISAVLDTNTLVSGLGWPRSKPAEVVDHALNGRFLPVTSPPLLNELARVLRYPKLVKVFDEPEAIVELVERMSLVVEPAARLRIVRDDEADNRVLEAARAAGTDFILTGDHHLLDLTTLDATRIVRAGDFAAVLDEAARAGQD